MYWGGIGPIFFNQKFIDINFMKSVRPILVNFFLLNIRMQDLYQSWAALDDDKKYPQGIFLDYAELPILQQLNSDLLEYKADDILLLQLQQNEKSAHELADEICQEAFKDFPELEHAGANSSLSPSSHLKEFFDEFTVC
tara:strand:- start:156 stop:572 length:417 start_codon:yes stop_codon:yes gene_type:complete